jgi:hypothetical protein
MPGSRHSSGSAPAAVIAMAEQHAAPAGNRGQELADRQVVGSSSAYAGTGVERSNVMVLPGDVCDRCHTWTSPWRCCCEGLRTTHSVHPPLTWAEVTARGMENQRRWAA